MVHDTIEISCRWSIIVLYGLLNIPTQYCIVPRLRVASTVSYFNQINHPHPHYPDHGWWCYPERSSSKWYYHTIIVLSCCVLLYNRKCDRFGIYTQTVYPHFINIVRKHWMDMHIDTLLHTLPTRESLKRRVLHNCYHLAKASKKKKKMCFRRFTKLQKVKIILPWQTVSKIWNSYKLQYYEIMYSLCAKQQ